MNIQQYVFPPDDVFLSYGHEDHAAAERLCNELKEHGVSVWFDKDALIGGEHWERAIKEAIKKARFSVPLLPSRSVRRPGFKDIEVNCVEGLKFRRQGEHRTQCAVAASSSRSGLCEPEKVGQRTHGCSSQTRGQSSPTW